MTTITQTITALPTPAPARLGQTEDVFVQAMDNLLGALPDMVDEQNTYASQVNTVASEINTHKTDASTYATQAAASASAAAASADVTKWISGTTYTEGDCVWSPIDYQTYRRKSTGGGTTDPSADSTNWVLIALNPAIFDVGSVLTTNTTLTSSSEKYIRTEPTGYGMTIKLPDATTMAVGGPRFIADNSNGAFDVRYTNNSDVLVAFVPAYKTAYISLKDDSDAAGSWGFMGAARAGCSAELETVYLDSLIQVIDIGSSREFILASNSSDSYLYCAMYTRTTNTWSDVVQIRAAAVASNAACILAAANKVLIISCTNAGTALEGVVVDTSGATPTVGAADTKTLSANLSGFSEHGSRLISSGSSFVISYRVATPACELRAITVSGDTVTIGNATTASGTQGTASTTGALITSATGGIIAATVGTTHLYTNHYTVSGSTLAAGTGTDTNSGTMTLSHLTALGSRFAVIYNDGGSTPKGGIVSLSGTVTTITTATLFSAGTVEDAEIVGSTKIVVVNNQSTNNINILTDSSGTASAGTAITQSSDTARGFIYVDGTDVVVESGTVSSRRFDNIDCSGASPVAGRVIAKSRIGIEALGASANAAFYRLGTNNLISTKYKRRCHITYSSSDASPVLAVGILENGNFRRESDSVLHPVVSTGNVGSAITNRWSTDNGTMIAKLECVA